MHQLPLLEAEQEAHELATHSMYGRPGGGQQPRHVAVCTHHQLAAHRMYCNPQLLAAWATHRVGAHSRAGRTHGALHRGTGPSRGTHHQLVTHCMHCMYCMYWNQRLLAA